MTVCSYHVTYTFQSESTLYSCLNVKELLARSRREIWSLSDCNWTRTHNHLVRKRTLNHLAKKAIFFFFFNDWAVLWVLICTVHLTVYSYHVTYWFQSQSTLDRPVWLNSWVFVYELSGCEFGSSCSHLLVRWFIQNNKVNREHFVLPVKETVDFEDTIENMSKFVIKVFVGLKTCIWFFWIK